MRKKRKKIYIKKKRKPIKTREPISAPLNIPKRKKEKRRPIYMLPEGVFVTCASKDSRQVKLSKDQSITVPKFLQRVPIIVCCHRSKIENSLHPECLHCTKWKSFIPKDWRKYHARKKIKIKTKTEAQIYRLRPAKKKKRYPI